MKKITALTAEEVLLLAISVEDRNETVYQEYAGLFDHYEPAAAKVFREMAVEERTHGKMLRDIYQEKFGRAPRDFSEEVKEPVEAPVLPDSEVFIYDTMSPAEAFAIARRTEELAQRFYEDLAKETQDAALRKLYQELADIEKGHFDEARRREEACRPGSKQENTP